LLKNEDEQTALIIVAWKDYNDVFKLLLEVDNYKKVYFLMLLKEGLQKLLKYLSHFHFKIIKGAVANWWFLSLICDSLFSFLIKK